MDGTLAAIYLIASLSDMAFNHCATGCFAPSDATARLSFQAGQVMFQEEPAPHEGYLGYDLSPARGPFQPTFGLSVTDEGSTWIGLGVKTMWEIGNDGFFVEGSVMPGYYWAGAGPDLGGGLQFRSALGGGFEFANGSTLALLYDHRSNAGLDDLNPGLETIGIRYAIALD